MKRFDWHVRLDREGEVLPVLSGGDQRPVLLRAGERKGLPTDKKKKTSQGKKRCRNKALFLHRGERLQKTGRERLTTWGRGEGNASICWKEGKIFKLPTGKTLRRGKEKSCFSSERQKAIQEEGSASLGEKDSRFSRDVRRKESSG